MRGETEGGRSRECVGVGARAGESMRSEKTGDGRKEMEKWVSRLSSTAQVNERRGRQTKEAWER